MRARVPARACGGGGCHAAYPGPRDRLARDPRPPPPAPSSTSHAETERAAVDTAQAYALQPRNSGLPRELFGVIVSELWELDVTSDTAITGWLEDAEGSSDPAVAQLLASKWTQWLLQQLDEDEEDEDEEDEDEEGDDEGDEE